MQIISCRINEGLVLDGQTTITVVEINSEEVTFEIIGTDGVDERLTLTCSPPAQCDEADNRDETRGEPVLVTH